MRWSSAASSTRAPRPSRRRGGWRSTSSACRRRARTCARSARGPRVGAPEKAVEGFLKSAGLASLDRGEDRGGPEEGRVLRRRDRAARPPDAGGLGRDPAGHHPRLPLAEIDALGRGLGASPGLCAGCARCTRSSAPSGRRPRRPRSCPSRSTASASGDVTHGHRFMAPDADPGAPLRRLRARRSSAPRWCSTPTGARTSSAPRPRTSPSRSGLELVEDEALLEEVAGLVEWPVVLMGAFDEAFLSIPPEVIRATIRANQKCFVLRSSIPSPLRGGAGVGVAGPDAELSGQVRAADAARTPSTSGLHAPDPHP